MDHSLCNLWQAMDQEVWNKLRQQLQGTQLFRRDSARGRARVSNLTSSRAFCQSLRRSLQDNIDEITTKFAPPRPYSAPRPWQFFAHSCSCKSRQREAVALKAEDRDALSQRGHLDVPHQNSPKRPITSRDGHALLPAFAGFTHPLRALPTRLPQPATSAPNTTVHQLQLKPAPHTSMASAKPLA